MSMEVLDRVVLDEAFTDAIDRNETWAIMMRVVWKKGANPVDQWFTDGPGFSSSPDDAIRYASREDAEEQAEIIAQVVKDGGPGHAGFVTAIIVVNLDA